MSDPVGQSPGQRRSTTIVVALPITLGQFMKVAGVASTGGEAKYLVASGEVRVNGVVETQRGRKLRPGDIVEGAGAVLEVRDRPAADSITV